MESFEYKVSVIVPVYNVEQYLKGCLDSLLAQTIDHGQMEILLINDGSTDNSLMICEEYAELFSCFKVFSQKNAGVSAARNVGIKNAKGKYIMFLDADDMYAVETVKEVTDFFEFVYDEVDLVTYKIIRYQNEKALPLHFRYNYLIQTDVYDLNQYEYISQTTINIVVKNNKDILFDTTLFQGENQKYGIECILEKMKLGYCHKGEYKYVIHDESALQSEKYSLYLFEQHTKIWEEFFCRYKEVPRYIQGLVLANYCWQLIADCIFPYHYKDEKYTEAVQRINKILNKIDVDIIINHPQMDMFHKHFFLSMKQNISPTVIFEKNNMLVLINGKVIYKRNNMEIILNSVNIEDDIIMIMGFVKSPIYNYIKSCPQVICVVDEHRYNVSVFDSINSYYKTKARTNNFFAFRFFYKCSDENELYFIVQQDGIEYDVHFYCVSSAVFNKKIGIDSFVRSQYKISLNNNIIRVSKISKKKKLALELNRKFLIDPPLEVYQIRKKVINFLQTQKVWIYSDNSNLGIDNGFYQFQHDWDKEDNVLRYYVYDGDKEEIINFFTKEQAKHLIEYGNCIHKILYLRAEYILASFLDIRPRNPFANDREFSYYRDLRQPKTIYLQQGVLHADLRWIQSAERCQVNKVVISSQYEKNNYINKYNYKEEDIIATGMPKFDYINKNSEPKNKILFAPSWRSYLLKRSTTANWDKNVSQLLKSNYFKKFTAFLNSNRLTKVLEENNLYIDVNFHPNMKSVLEFLNIDSERINIITDHVKIVDYIIFITYISSYFFDYVYLSRSVIYFMPDMEEFESGMHFYRKLHLPYDKAFGNITIESEETIDELIRIIKNGFFPDQVFKERMDSFFLPLSNCSEKLYQYLTKEEQ